MSQPPAASSARPPRAVATPCVMVCTVDGASGLCLGCFRTLPEIATWSRMSDEERATIMAELGERRRLIDPVLLGE
ncbi:MULTISPECIES: DUF1289 domain-containing protein [unclassified Brevundimonas]|uniref:DUF1289 domain-containing protein n=1 Tax=unclassified Brevundimonas TaxID=2622653 RepID=UPI0025C4BEE7|nr:MULTISPECIES: DUF1289 domain-containing protein [unclassified Brevundimonas]